jgi:hypothetical protein
MPQQLNMNREYRTELKTLRKNRRQLQRERAAGARLTDRALRLIEHEASQRRKATLRDFDRCERAAKKAAAALDRRIGILEGRLS